MSEKTDKSQNPQPLTKVKTTRHENGKVKSKIPYVNGKKHGAQTEWWHNGQVQRRETRRDGAKHGADRWWFIDGNKWTETIHVNGKKHGMMTVWYGYGRKEREIYYILDREYARIEWDAEGNATEVTVPLPYPPSPQTTKPNGVLNLKK